jgi:hypothetical protein
MASKESASQESEDGAVEHQAGEGHKVQPGYGLGQPFDPCALGQAPAEERVSCPAPGWVLWGGEPPDILQLISYNLAMLSERDSTVLTNRSGNAYKYRRSRICVNKPDGGWLLDPVRNRDTVTLQTCPYPTFENRFIVRADRA